MDSRSFTIGLVCGVVVGALAVWLIGSSSGDEVLQSAEQAADVMSTSEVVTVAPLVVPEPQKRSSGKIPEASEPQSSAETNVDPVAPWPENRRAELQSEPKDDSWAYYMEQTLLQYLSAHPSIDQFDISSIECRTTKCQIEVFGFDESTVPVWQQVMYDIRQQSWNEFGQTGSGSGNVDGRLVIIATLHRKSEP